MRRASLVVALGLAGCMRIYPDPELPDIEVTWYEGDCAEGTGDVSIVATGIDDTSEQHDATVACTSAKTTFADVSRQRFRVVGQLHDSAGGFYSEDETEVDLRNGFNQEAFLYFGGFDNFRIAWTFDMGATCTSLGAVYVTLELRQGDSAILADVSSCDAGFLSSYAPEGSYTVTLYANPENSGPVAMSAPLDVTIAAGMRTDLGTVVLTPTP